MLLLNVVRDQEPHNRLIEHIKLLKIPFATHAAKSQMLPSIDPTAIQHMIQESVAATLLGAISSALAVASFSSRKLSSSVWHIDSKASNHMTGDLHNFSSLTSHKKSNNSIIVANGDILARQSYSFFF